MGEMWCTQGWTLLHSIYLTSFVSKVFVDCNIVLTIRSLAHSEIRRCGLATLGEDVKRVFGEVGSFSAILLSQLGLVHSEDWLRVLVRSMIKLLSQRNICNSRKIHNKAKEICYCAYCYEKNRSSNRNNLLLRLKIKIHWADDYVGIVVKNLWLEDLLSHPDTGSRRKCFTVNMLVSILLPFIRIQFPIWRHPVHPGP